MAKAKAAKALWGSLEGFGKNVAKYSKASNYLNRAVEWGAYGAAIGGVTQWANGGSFWEGAKGGAVTGAAIGAGYTAFKAGMGPKHRLTAKGKSFVKNNKAGDIKLNRKSWETGAGKEAAEDVAKQAGSFAGTDRYKKRMAYDQELKTRAQEAAEARKKGLQNIDTDRSRWSAEAEFKRLKRNTPEQRRRLEESLSETSSGQMALFDIVEPPPLAAEPVPYTRQSQIKGQVNMFGQGRARRPLESRQVTALRRAGKENARAKKVMNSRRKYTWNG